MARSYILAPYYLGSYLGLRGGLGEVKKKGETMFRVSDHVYYIML